MSRDLNKVQITGRLAGDPVMRRTNGGSALATFRVASQRVWRSSQGQNHSATEWFHVAIWDRLAEDVVPQLQRGARVYIEGRLQMRQWLDREGRARVSAELIASEIIVLAQAHIVLRPPITE